MIIDKQRNQPSSDNSKKRSDFKGIFSSYLYYWPLFVIAIVAGIAGAYIYLQNASPSYEIKAVLQINDKEKDPDQKSLLQQLAISTPSILVENEIEVLKSMRLISEVVRDLQLSTVYQLKTGLGYRDLYHSGPVKFTLLKTSAFSSDQPMVILILNEKFCILKTPKGNERLRYGSVYKNSTGSWKLEPTTRLHEYIGETIKITSLNPEKVALGYQQSINAELINKVTTSIGLSIDDEVPQRGKDILNRLIFGYNKMIAQEKTAETQRTLLFIDQRLSSLTGELNHAESNIQGFKSSRGLTDIPSETKFSLENKQANIARLNEINVQLSVVDGIERYVNSSPNAAKVPATLGITDPGLTSLIERLTRLEVQREKLLATTPETNPDFEPVNRQIATIRSAIQENVKNIKSSLLIAKRQLSSFNAGFDSSIKDIPVQEREYISIKRQQSIKENLYLYLLQKREELSLSYASTLTNERVVDHAYVGPVKGLHGPLTYVIAVLCCLAILVLILYLIKSFKNKITNAQDIEETLMLPIVNELNFDTFEPTIFKNNGLNNVIVEQLRALRINLHYLHRGNTTGRVTLITSSVTGEGKSFVSNSLAIALAHSGRKTIILELDMRKPKIAEIFDLPKDHLGISDFLKGEAPMDAVIQSSGLMPNLDIISRGINNGGASELLEKRQLQDMIAQLREEYDDVIMDSPPLHLVADAIILSRLADVTLYLIRQGFTEKSELEFIYKLHTQNKISGMNIIFNGIKSRQYGYGYKYNGNYYANAEH